MTLVTVQIINADVAELVDAQDLKSCGRIIRAGSIPAICTIKRAIFTKVNIALLLFHKTFTFILLTIHYFPTIIVCAKTVYL